MSQEFFGYNREINPNGQVMSSEYATISLGGAGAGRINLVQQVNAQYSQTVNPAYEVGSANLFWIAGQPSGTIQFGRLVGKGGFLAEFGSLRNTCGSLLSVILGLNGSGGCSVNIDRGSTINFSGGMVTGLGFSYAAGTLRVEESVSMVVASMSQG